MKRILLSVILVALAISINAQLRPTIGNFATVNLGTDSIICEDDILTGKIFIEIDTLMSMSNTKIGIDQTINMIVTFKIYKSYYRYRNWFNPIRPNGVATSFTVYNIDIIDGWYPEVWLPAVTKTRLALIFDVAESAITYYSYN